MKNPHAVALGRLGGLRGGAAGGRARATMLSPERRREIGRRAVEARWGHLPESIRDLFWAYGFEKLRLDKDLELVMQQVLVYGDKKQKAWLVRRFGDEGIRKWIVGRKGRGLSLVDMAPWVSARTANKWQSANPHALLWERR